jgi:uncharacterized membrane protein YoaK (UPF0700 family)
MILTAKIFRGVQFIASFVTLVLALLLLIYIAISDASLPEQFHEPLRKWIVPSLMLIAPPLLLAIASYLQTMRRQSWAIALVFIAGICNAVFVPLNAGLWYVSLASGFLQWLILANTVALVITVGTAIGNLLFQIISDHLCPHNADQIVGRGRRERVS